MVEAVVLWNEPNNLSHWNFKMDPGWTRFADMVKLASRAVRNENPELTIVLGGVSSSDCDFLRLMKTYGVMDYVDAVGVHGFPLDWNHWEINEWPKRIDEAAAVSGRPVWVLEVGASSFGAEEVQTFGFERTTSLLKGKSTGFTGTACMTFLPPGQQRQGIKKRRVLPTTGTTTWVCFVMMERRNKRQQVFLTTARLAFASGFILKIPASTMRVAWMKAHHVQYLRTGLSWADSFRPNATAWFDRMMQALEPFNVSLTLCFTPAHLGIEEHHTSAPRDNQLFADFASWAVERYASANVALCSTY